MLGGGSCSDCLWGATRHGGYVRILQPHSHVTTPCKSAICPVTSTSGAGVSCHSPCSWSVGSLLLMLGLGDWLVVCVTHWRASKPSIGSHSQHRGIFQWGKSHWNSWVRVSDSTLTQRRGLCQDLSFVLGRDRNWVRIVSALCYGAFLSFSVSSAVMAHELCSGS